MSACEELASRFETLKQDGLVDVKFLFHNTDDFTEEMFCDEALALLDAYTSGQCVELKVSDTGRKN